MKLGPLDLNQPSTWRGLLGFAGVIGFSLHPELRDQIATTLAALLCLIEMLRDEYRATTARDLTPTATATTTGPERAEWNGRDDIAAHTEPIDANQLRVPARPDAADHANPESPSGFNDR